MVSLPTPIVNYIYQLTVENRSPAYLLIDKDGCLSNWGGKLSAYGVTNLQKGKDAEQQILFLAGLLPLNDFPLFLPCVKMPSGLSADIHVFPTEEGDWVLLLDATLDKIQRSQMQQKGNDLSLIRKKQSKILNQYLSTNVGEQLTQGLLTVQKTGEYRNITILLVNICHFNSYIQNYSPEELFRILNSYLPYIIQPLVDEGGMVDRIRGDTVVTLFGVLPTTGASPVHAFQAAIRMIEAVREVSKVQQVNSHLKFDTGIGIASGTVALGTVGSQAQKTFIVAGDHLKLAEKLGVQARPSEILIDDNTFNQLGELQKYFSLIQFLGREIIEPVPTYSYLLK